MYADYAFYADSWHGNMPETEFAKWGARAGLEIDRLTQGRAAAAPPEMAQPLRCCCCALADALRTADAVSDATQGGAVASETVDGYSVSYRTDADAAQTDPTAEAGCAARLCRRWLCAPVNLMYTGVSG